MRTSAPLLRVRDLSLTHAGAVHPSPHDVSFVVHPGEVILVLGPSGSGKSTLTLALNGLIPQSVPAEIEGTVEVNGRSTVTTSVASLSTDVAMVFQDPDAQLVTGTLLDEVAFALENLLLPVDEVLRRTEAALRRVGLWERRSWNPDRLSGGGRQRLAIACALAMGSPVIVLDEPTANLDPQGIDDVYDALSELVAAGDRAIVLVEHNLDAAMRFATRALVLDRDGRLAFDGPVAEVIRNHSAELVEMGVWLPAATLAALRLRGGGVSIDPLPLTPEQLRDALTSRSSSEDARSDEPKRSDERTDFSASSEEGVSSRFARSTTGVQDARSTTGVQDAPSMADSESAIVRVRGLTVKRHRAEILHGIDLDIEAGSLTAIVGANGAGKTTLIQSIAGVVPPPRRQVTIDDLDPGAASPRDLAARIGFVFQNPEHQFIAHTVFDELAHGLTLRQAQGRQLRQAQGRQLRQAQGRQLRQAQGTKLSDAEIAQRVGEMLTRFGLEAKADTHPFLLSGGEKRRLSVGTALITRPRVLALDEPTFGQDRARAAELLSLLQDLRGEGTTIVIVTHDLQLVADHTSHTVILADGRVHAAGRTSDLFREENLFTDAGLRLPALHRVLPPGLRQLHREGTS